VPPLVSEADYAELAINFQGRLRISPGRIRL
jgi:hypothetical protein